MRFVAIALAAVMASTVAMQAQSGALSGRRAPSFALPDVNLNYHDILDYRGKILILEIIQTTCPSCGAFQKVVQNVLLAYPGKVTTMTIVNPPDNQQSVQRFISQFNVKTPVLFDSGQTAAIYMKATPQNPTVHLPHVFLIDAKGTIRNDYSYDDNPKFFESLDPLKTEVGKLVAELGGGTASKSGASKSAPKK